MNHILCLLFVFILCSAQDFSNGCWENVLSSLESERLTQAQQIRQDKRNPCTDSLGYLCAALTNCRGGVIPVTPIHPSPFQFNTTMYSWLNMTTEEYPLKSYYWWTVPTAYVSVHSLLVVVNFKHKQPLHIDVSKEMWSFFILSGTVAGIWTSVEQQYKLDLMTAAAYRKYVEAQFITECENGVYTDNVLDWFLRVVNQGPIPTVTYDGQVLSDKCKNLLQRYRHHAPTVMESFATICFRAFGSGLAEFFGQLSFITLLTVMLVSGFVVLIATHSRSNSSKKEPPKQDQPKGLSETDLPAKI